ncbi:MAG: outer membrane protein assembly factor BamD [Gemmatimonadetes bacterium]|nr:MAG: outer membrane protein assembly factor BamD [Gemmatimonadota bacterium]
MKYFVSSSLVLIILFTGSGRHAEAEIAWLDTYEDALIAAETLNRPIMIDFYTNWCGWCKRLDQTTYRNVEVLALADDFVCAKVNAEGVNFDRNILKKYNITGYPAVLFLDEEGLVIGEVRGYKPAKPFLTDMEKSLSRYNELQAAKAAIRKNPKDVQSAYTLGRTYLMSGQADKAKKYYQVVIDEDPANQSNHVPDVLLELGMIHGQTKEYQQALSYFSQFTEQYTMHERRPEALYFTGVTFYMMQNIEMAKKSFQMLVDEYPSSPLSEKAKQMLVKL